MRNDQLKSELNKIGRQLEKKLMARLDIPKKTKIIYLNEDDRPKKEEPLGLIDWVDENHHGLWNYLNAGDQDSLADEWLKYREEFIHNNKPIEFDNKTLYDYELKIIVVHSPTVFTVFTQNNKVHSKISGKLNSGKI